MGSSESSMFFLLCVAFGLLGCTVFWVILFKRGKGERREIRGREGRETGGEIVGPTISGQIRPLSWWVH